MVCPKSFGQTKVDGKLRIIFNERFLTKSNDSTTLYLLYGENIIFKQSVSELQNKFQSCSNACFIEKYFHEGIYTFVIEHLTIKPIIITNVLIRKKVMNFLPLEYDDINKNYSTLDSIILMDAAELFKRYDQKYQDNTKVQ